MGGGWRLPTIVELGGQEVIGYATGGIIDLTAPGCSSGSPCINTIFGPTVSGLYWSSSTLQNNTTYVWYVYFLDGYSYIDDKTTSHSVRAVRGGP